MKKILAVICLACFVVSFSEAQIGKRPAVDALRITAYDSLASRGPLQVLGVATLSGGGALTGTFTGGTFSTATVTTAVAKADSSTTNGPSKWYTTTMTNAALALKANLASPTFTGTAALPIVTVAGKVTGNASLNGVRTFSTAGNIDTLVISGLTSTSSVVITPVLTVVGDTATFNVLHFGVRMGVSDTAFVYQMTTKALAAVKYAFTAIVR